MSSLLRENFIKRVLKNVNKPAFSECHHPYNHNHSNEFDESEFCKQILG